MCLFRKSIFFIRGDCLRKIFLQLITIFLLLLSPLTVFPHEFWIEPERWILEKGETLTAHTKVGQQFKGDASPFIRAWFSRFELHASKMAVPVEGNDGDFPAFKLKLNHLCRGGPPGIPPGALLSRAAPRKTLVTPHDLQSSALHLSLIHI